MNNQELYKILELPLEVVTKLNAYEQERNFQCSEEVQKRMLGRTTWDAAVKELQFLLGEDPDGFKILWEMLDLTCRYSYEQYRKRNIPEEVFAATIKFISRFLDEHYRTYGTYQFTKAWWYPRQLALEEFRIGALEYEFIDGENREIAIHIPSDADFGRASVVQSLKEFALFRNTYFSKWEGVPFTCDSWMLAPALKELLNENSNILEFQHMFEIDEVDEEATWFMEWIFPGYEEVDDRLPEKTSLQRKAKAYLLAGKKLGVAKGHLKEEFSV